MSVKMSEKIPSTNTGDTKQDEKLMLPLSYLQNIPGQQIRYKIIPAFNNWLQIPVNKLLEVEEIVHTIYNTSLLVDDMQDNSILRRGIPVAHSIYGVACTYNAAKYILHAVFERVLKLGHEEAIHIFSEQLLEVHRGQGIDIYWRDNFICPTIEEYNLMTISKTGGLTIFTIKLMQLFSDNKLDFTALVNKLSLYYQIRNDFGNLWMKEFFKSKGYCEDLTDGKFSFPLVHAINKQPGDNQVLNILRQKTNDVEVKRHCVSLLEDIGSFQYTRETLERLDKEIREEVEKLGGNPLLISLLEDLLNWKDDIDIMKTTVQE